MLTVNVLQNVHRGKTNISRPLIVAVVIILWRKILAVLTGIGPVWEENVPALCCATEQKPVGMAAVAYQMSSQGIVKEMLPIRMAVLKRVLQAVVFREAVGLVLAIGKVFVLVKDLCFGIINHRNVSLIVQAT